MLLPFKPIKFTLAGTINAVDGSGISYDFGGTEIVYNAIVPTTTGWDLSRMTSATDSSNFISFINAPFSEQTYDYTENVPIYDVITIEL